MKGILVMEKPKFSIRVLGNNMETLQKYRIKSLFCRIERNKVIKIFLSIISLFPFFKWINKSFQIFHIVIRQKIIKLIFEKNFSVIPILNRIIIERIGSRSVNTLVADHQIVF